VVEKPVAHDACAGGEVRDCNILHVDMDSFFASVEVLDDPSLAGKPVIVGGSGARGVVASCTYEARVYGIHSAMPSLQARRRCPQAIFLNGRYDRYAQMSEKLHSVLLGFTPLVEGVGLDEAFLDVRGASRLLGSPLDIAHAIRAKVREELLLDCSVGVGRRKMFAKLASRAAKPRVSGGRVHEGLGVVVVAPSDETEFLHPLPIRALWGVGPATAERLGSLGVVTVGDLARVPHETLNRLLGPASGGHIGALARGEDDRAVEPSREVKSVGHEETFADDIHTRLELRRHVARMSDAVASRLAEAQLRGRTVTLKVRYRDRKTITRSHTLADPSSSARIVASVASTLLESVEVSEGVRLIGVSVSMLSRSKTRNRQLSFDVAGDAHVEAFEEYSDSARPGRRDPASSAAIDNDGAWEDLEAVLRTIRARYGQAAVASASLVGPAGISVKRRGDTQWGPSDRSGGEKTGTFPPGPSEGPPAAGSG
jgi:DNA polymerase-4